MLINESLCVSLPTNIINEPARSDYFNVKVRALDHTSCEEFLFPNWIGSGQEKKNSRNSRKFGQEKNENPGSGQDKNIFPENPGTPDSRGSPRCFGNK